ncbi:hypothetical protein Trydic_g15266 [Trypoxylus dichotomus]
MYSTRITTALRIPDSAKHMETSTETAATDRLNETRARTKSANDTGALNRRDEELNAKLGSVFVKFHLITAERFVGDCPYGVQVTSDECLSETRLIYGNLRCLLDK